MIIFYNFLVSQREVTWNKYYHMLYVDNPVRTGFSFTRSDKGLVTNQVQVAQYLYRYSLH